VKRWSTGTLRGGLKRVTLRTWTMKVSLKVSPMVGPILTLHFGYRLNRWLSLHLASFLFIRIIALPAFLLQQAAPVASDEEKDEAEVDHGHKDDVVEGRVGV
jgi:hypothetical protein